VLVPPSDPQSLSAALGQLAADAEMRHAMGVAARKRYEELFTPRAVLPLLVEFYERMRDQKAGSSNGKVSAAHPWAAFNK
jgi:glycosyltransferase involved in cell wall biosynthesis